MMNNQTRSEIEQAFARSNNSIKRTIEPTIESRGSTIIGGNISGIKRPKRSRFGIGWWFSIGIAILVAIVLLIPTPERKVEQPSSQLAKLPKQTESDPIYQDSRIQEDNQNTAKNDELTKINDLKRAEEFRISEETNTQIRKFTEKATTAIRKGAYTEPKESSALKYYYEILKISPDNTFALNGIDYITERLAVIGTKHIEKGSLEDARSALSTLFSINSNSKQYIELSDKIIEYELSAEGSLEKKEINALKKKVATAIKRSRFTTPAGDNALLYYQQILIIDPENKFAATGTQNLAGRYALMANEALNASKLEKAESYVATIMAISPEHPSLTLLTNRIVKVNKIRLKQSSRRDIEKSVVKPAATEITKTTVVQQNVKKISSDNQITDTGTTSTNQTDKTNSIDDKLSENSSKELDEVRLKNGLGAYYSGNYQRAIEYLQPLADKGIARAQVRIGYMYYLGRGVNQDQSTGEKYFKNAMSSVTQFAQDNRAWAQADMGSLFEDGIILKQNYPSAVEWYRKAADQGYAGAQTNLGNMYYGGRGVEQNTKTAIDWFKLAAKNGDAVAKRNLVALGVSSN